MICSACSQVGASILRNLIGPPSTANPAFASITANIDKAANSKANTLRIVSPHLGQTDFQRNRQSRWKAERDKWQTEAENPHRLHPPCDQSMTYWTAMPRQRGHERGLPVLCCSLLVLWLPLRWDLPVVFRFHGLIWQPPKAGKASYLAELLGVVHPKLLIKLIWK